MLQITKVELIWYPVRLKLACLYVRAKRRFERFAQRLFHAEARKPAALLLFDTWPQLPQRPREAVAQADQDGSIRHCQLVYVPRKCRFVHK